MIILTLTFLGNSCSKPKPEIVMIGDAHVVGKLANGNYEITPAVLMRIDEILNENERLALEIEALKLVLKILKKEEVG